MTNLDKVSIALSEWAFNVAASVLPQFSIPANSTLGHFMGMLNVDPTRYNIWKELGFLAEPMIQTIVSPAVNRMLAGMPDEQIPDLAKKFVNSFLEQAEKKGSINLFGLELGRDAFEGLREILTSKLEE
jgi:hypothetical protein